MFNFIMKSSQNNTSGEKLLVSDLNKSKAILGNINWNFYQKNTFLPNEVRPFKCTSYHWFPSTFVPEIPFTLIEVLTLPGAVVYDPFSGIGTTYFQALLLNRLPLGTEICRVSVEYVRSLFVLFNPEINFVSLMEDLKKANNSFDDKKNYIKIVPDNILIDELKPWYSQKTLNQLAYLFSEEANCDNKEKKAVMRITLSGILKTLNCQDRGWGCIADNMHPKESQIKDKKVLDLFTNHSSKLMRDISEHLAYIKSDPSKIALYNSNYKKLSAKETLLNRDVRECSEIPDNSVDLVVTSPPYPNMTDYVTSQRLSYYYLGFDFSTDLKLEIGARSRRNKKDSLETYSKDMQKANNMISRKIKQGGYACYVMPRFNKDKENNIKRREIIDNIMNLLPVENGLTKVGEFERILPQLRRSQNQKWASLERETIYLFKKK
jgi:DNA modification methylase